VEKVVAGYRMPTALDTVQSITYVLTQEAGKLKPKDLKVAIDRNRAEREARLEEQEKLREQGGGMGLDLNGILAEERLYTGVSDPFRRQLREMAFLADVDDVRKQEAEKEFRASEVLILYKLMIIDDWDFIKTEGLYGEELATTFNDLNILSLTYNSKLIIGVSRV
jgi:hypothetical protein